MSSSQVVELCQILVQSNLQLCELIKENGLDLQDLYSHFKRTANKINKLGEIVEKNEEIHEKKNPDVRKSDELSIMTKNLIN